MANVGGTKLPLPNVGEFEHVLKQMLVGETVGQAAELLNNHYLKNPNSIPILLQLGVSSIHPEIRQLALVLMRKKIVSHWSRLNSAQNEEVKRTLLEILVKEQSPPVIRSACDVISVIARVTIPGGQWKELLQFLFQCSQSNASGHREIAMSLFTSLTETVGDNLSSYFATMNKLFIQGLQDPEHNVRVAALKASLALVHYLNSEEEAAQFKESLPMIVNVVQHCLQNGLDEEAIIGFEVFIDLLDCVNYASVAQCIPYLVQFVLQVGANKDLDDNVRQHALSFVEFVLDSKPKMLVKNNLVGPIVQVVFPMCAEPEENEDDEDELSSHRFASQMIDRLSLNVPSSKLFPILMEYINAYIVHQDPNFRKAALIALGVAAEGCNEAMIEPDVLPHLLELIYKGFQDREQGVREAACIAIGHFARYLQPEILEHYQPILVNLFNCLDDATEKVRMGSVNAIDAFCEQLGEEVLPYLDPLMTKLTQMLHVGNLEVKEISLSAISSVANAAGQAFLPYSQQILQICTALMQSTNESELELRCRATECVGLIAIAVGKDMFQPVIKNYMDMALKGVVIEDNTLREFTYGFFGNIAEVFKEEFCPYLPIVMPIVLASCDSADGISLSLPHGQDNSVPEIEDDDEEGEVGGAAYNFSVRTGFLDEKSSACHAIGMFAEHCGPQFLPYIERVMKSFQNLTSYFHEDVRKAVMESMKQICICIHGAFPQEWKKGLPRALQPLHVNTQQFVDTIVPIYVDKIQQDDDKLTVIASCQCLGEIATKIGPAALDPHLPSVMVALCSILTKKSVCQTAQGEEQYEEDEDLDAQVIESSCDALVDIVKVLGILVAPYFETLCKSVLTFQKAKSTASRSLAVGVVAELVNAIGSAVTPYFPELIKVAFAGMDDKDDETKSNSTFLCGLLFQNASSVQQQYYGEALNKLARIFTIKTDLPNLVDNCCGAVARMIMANPTFVPLAQVLPVFLAALPLKKDFEENTTVYSCVFHLFNSSNEALAANLKEMIRVFGEVLGSMDVAQNIQEEMVKTLKTLLQNYGTQMQSVLQRLSPEHQQNIQKYVSLS